ncbi:hypothetical protein FYL08_05655 [Lactobacillus salivarius]|uniref:hypothetical protein n=1 Tax=Ligilactobacillus salivarius TaxID=1624 RepID=UPI001370C2EE|nr:hypothetical protein [Ligilactobacillus salivarius]MYZ24520.1 hypothetical protein [Ligilactobacillus salivarius]
MYKMIKFIGSEVTKSTQKINNSILMFNSVVFDRKNISFSSKYKVPKDDKSSIREDYKRIGKDIYKVLNNYEQINQKRLAEQ